MNTKTSATATAVAYVSTATTSFEARPVAAVSAAVPDVAVYPNKPARPSRASAALQ